MTPKAYTPRNFTEVVAIQVNVARESLSEVEEVFYFVYGNKWKNTKDKGLLIKDYLRNLFCNKKYTFRNVYKDKHASYWEKENVSIEVHDFDYIVKPKVFSDPSLIEVYDEKTFNSIFLEISD
jgi:hypothetical protein